MGACGLEGEGFGFGEAAFGADGDEDGFGAGDEGGEAVV